MIKTFIKTLDNRFLGRSLQTLFEFLVQFPNRFLNKREYRRLTSNLKYRIEVNHDKELLNSLSQLCDLYGSDKGEVVTSGHPYSWPSHTYADYYSRLFSHCRSGVQRVFECGLGTNNPLIASSMGERGKPGASLRVWRDYFPNAEVYGADIDKDVLFSEERIKTFYVDQTDVQSVIDLWKTVGIDDFDFMIDDGLHSFEAGSILFENSIEKLAPHGIYVIEDVSSGDQNSYRKFFEGSSYVVDYVSLFRPSEPLGDNNLVVIRKP
jgi:hypothetical protein